MYVKHMIVGCLVALLLAGSMVPMAIAQAVIIDRQNPVPRYGNDPRQRFGDVPSRRWRGEGQRWRGHDDRWMERHEREYHTHDRQRRRDEHYGGYRDGRWQAGYRDGTPRRGSHGGVEIVPEIEVIVDGISSDSRASSGEPEAGPDRCRQASGSRWSSEAIDCPQPTPPSRSQQWSTDP